MLLTLVIDEIFIRGKKKEQVIKIDDLSCSVARTGIEPVFPE
jgi:hypothetical protein